MVILLEKTCLKILYGEIMNRRFYIFFLIIFFLFNQLYAKKIPYLPWDKAKKENLPPGLPDKDYTPVVVPNGTKATYKIIDGVKVFHLIAEAIEWEVAPGFIVHTWGYNGCVPGPLIELTEKDKVRIYVTNNLIAPTTIHWHGVLLPCGMDGVAGLTQRAIPPKQTFVYEFFFPESGTFMYHPHFDNMTQEGMGLTGMIVVHKREKNISKRPNRDFAIMLHEWNIDVGTSRPNTLKTNFNILTMNGKVMPATEPLIAELGDNVWIRFGNLSAMDHHPIHLHGYSFKIIGSDGGWVKDKSVILPETTVLVPVGSAKVIEFFANNPGDWIFHCHMTHHIMNQMGHEFPNMLGMETDGFNEKVCKLIPEYVAKGTKGMRDMTESGMPIPQNSIPMLGYDGQFGKTVIGGMANILKVRKKTDNYKDPGPYAFPKQSIPYQATSGEILRDEIILPDKNK
jgi:hypothetical protein